MNQERKISVLRNLLDRVQKRTAAPRVAAAPASMAAAPTAPAASPVAATPMAAAPPFAVSAPPAQPPKTSGRPGSSTLPLNFGSSSDAASVRPSPDAVSERPADEAEQGPPSAPRLRELTEDDVVAEAREIDEEEPPIKTPPPESGRQHVTPGPTVTVSESDEDISITVTMEESETPPSVSPTGFEAAPMSASGLPDIPEVSGPQPRLALVSEPEIELHGMTPLSAIAEPMAPVKPPPAPEPRSAPDRSFRSQDIDLAVPVPSSVPSVPSAAPSGVRPMPPPPPPAPAPAAPFARTAPSPDTQPSVSSAGPPESAAAPPVRLMAQPVADAAGKPLPPVEVWASTFTPAALRGQVASFVGQNANFEPKTFGELVRASIALGEDKS